MLRKQVVIANLSVRGHARRAAKALAEAEAMRMVGTAAVWSGRDATKRSRKDGRIYTPCVMALRPWRPLPIQLRAVRLLELPMQNERGCALDSAPTLEDDRSMTTIYEAAGGAEVFERLAEATHRRCLADPELNHPFSHSTNHPDHVARLAAYWAEALGGPPTYSTQMGSESHVQRLHAGEGDYTRATSPRFVQCVIDSFDEAGVPDDPKVRRAITSYVTWAASEPFQAWPDSADDVPDGLHMPRWGWDGPTT